MRLPNADEAHAASIPDDLLARGLSALSNLGALTGATFLILAALYLLVMT